MPRKVVTRVLEKNVLFSCDHIYFPKSKCDNAAKIISETLCINRERQCTKGELLQVRQRSDNLCSYN